MSFRYGTRTFALELVMIAVALVFLFPVYALITPVVQERAGDQRRRRSRCRPRRRPTTSRRRGSGAHSAPR